MTMISVKDRLPDKAGWYLVYAPKYWTRSRTVVCDGYTFTKFDPHRQEPWGIECCGQRYVECWAPLPDIPSAPN